MPPPPRGRDMVIAVWLKEPRHVQVHNKRPEKHIKRGQNMLYIGYLIILDGKNTKLEISIFELLRPKNCISRLCALDPLEAPPPNTPKG